MKFLRKKWRSVAELCQSAADCHLLRSASLF
jgi:hypothetical protein